MEFATRTIHAAQPSEPGTGSLVAPIFQTSTYEQDEPGVHQGFDYSRTNNPTRARLEQVLAALEGVAHAAVFASGLAAETAVLQAWLKPGDEVIIPLDVYGGTYRLLTGSSSRSGASFTRSTSQTRGSLRQPCRHGRARLDRIAYQSPVARVRHSGNRRCRPCAGRAARR